MAKKEVSILSREDLFVQEYLVDGAAGAAAIRAGYSPKSASTQATYLLKKQSVIQKIADAQKDIMKRTKVNQERMIDENMAIIEADIADYVNITYDCCRHCYGKDHHYQYIDEEEYTKAVLREEALAAKENRDPVLIENLGGYGFNPTYAPHPHCPKCFGRGIESMQITDTRRLTKRQRKAISGIKRNTTGGIEVMFHDKQKAMEAISKHLGMFIERREVGAAGDFDNLSDRDLIAEYKKLNAEATKYGELIEGEFTAGVESEKGDGD